MIRGALVPVLSLATLLAGCASTLSGVGGSDTYACKAPEGVLCTSVAGVYANSIENNLPGQRIEKPQAGLRVNSLPPARPPLVPALTTDGSALRSSPRILRLWIAPWEDSDGDLHQQSLLYVIVDTGRWLIENQRPAIRPEFMPITPPKTVAPVGSDPAMTSDPEPRRSLPPVSAFVPSAKTEPVSEEPSDAQ